MNLKWHTFDESWANGEILIKDFKKRLPNVLSDAKLPKNQKNIDKFLNKNLNPNFCSIHFTKGDGDKNNDINENLLSFNFFNMATFFGK